MVINSHTKKIEISSLTVLFLFAHYPAMAVPIYDLTTLGLADAVHTDSDTGNRHSFAKAINEAGHVIGISDFERPPINDDFGFTVRNSGRAAWLYDGSTTTRLGFTDSSHTGVDEDYYTDIPSLISKQVSTVTMLNEAGQVAGRSARYSQDLDGFSQISGYSAWFYDGSTTIRLGDTNQLHGENRNSTITALNEAGQVLGNSAIYGSVPNYLFEDRTINTWDVPSGQSAWVYDGSTTQRLGFTGADYTNGGTAYPGAQTSSSSLLNEAGQVAGISTRYYNDSHSEPVNIGDIDYIYIPTGQSAWVYDGSITERIGLTDTEHTNAYIGTQSSSVSALNEAGQVIGESNRYNNAAPTGIHPDPTDAGQSAWVYTRSTTQRLGLTDAMHTNSDTGYQYSSVNLLNETGQVIGESNRYYGDTDNGQSAWLYTGSTIQRIGLTDTEHTHSGTGYQYSSVSLLNEAGQVIGESNRYYGDTDNGQSAWLYKGSTIQRIGLTDAEHTNSDTGYQASYAKLLNEAGQVIGTSNKYSGSTSSGTSLWFYDSFTNTTVDLTFSTRLSDSFAFTSANFLSDDGIVLGSYRLFDNINNTESEHAYWWNMDEGFFDLGTLVDGGLEANGWESLYNVISMNSSGQIIGTGLSYQNDLAFLLTPQNEGDPTSPQTADPVPEPATMVLFGTGLICLLGTRIRKKKQQ